jgi:hypothetical protein
VCASGQENGSKSDGQNLRSISTKIQAVKKLLKVKSFSREQLQLSNIISFKHLAENLSLIRFKKALSTFFFLALKLHCFCFGFFLGGKRKKEQKKMQQQGQQI